MAGTHTVLSVPVQIDTEIFHEFAVFDVIRRRKRWVRPLVFAVLLLFAAVFPFLRGDVIPGVVLVVLGIGLPAVYFGMFFHSVNQQAQGMGLDRPRIAYRVDLDENGVRMWPAGKQDKAAEAVTHAWADLYGAWRTPTAIYLYNSATQAYLLPVEQIPGGADALWTLLQAHMPAAKLHITR